MGGAENVLEEFVALFPGAPIFTSMYGPDKMPDFLPELAHPYHLYAASSTGDGLPSGLFAALSSRVPDNRPEWVRPDFEQQERILPRDPVTQGQSKGLAHLLLPDTYPIPVALRTVPAARTDR